jgi:hypothetical protein
MWITELNSNEEMKLGSALWLVGDKNLNSGAAHLHQEEGQTKKTKTETEWCLTGGSDRTKQSKHRWW